MPPPSPRPGPRRTARRVAGDLVARHRDDTVATLRQHGSVQASSPASTATPRRPVAQIVAIWSRFPLRLLDGDHARVLGEPQERRGLDVRPVRDGTL